MKAQFLKIAKVKDEKAFYKKYPTEEAFFKAHPEARSIKKAEIGAYIGGDTIVNPKMIDYRSEYDKVDKMITGYTDEERREAAQKAAAAKQSSGGGGGFDISSIMGMFGGSGGGSQGGGSVGEGIMSSGGFGAIGGGIGSGGIGGARYGKHIPKAQWGTDANGNSIPDYLENTQPQMGPTQNFSAQSFPPLYSPNAQQTGQNAFQSPNAFATPNYGQQFMNNANQTTAGMTGIPQGLPSNIGYTAPQSSGSGGGGGGFDAMKGIPIIGGIIGGIQGLKAQKEAKRAAKQAKLVSDVTLKASATRPEESKRRYVTPWDNIVQPDQMFPSYGVGTNVLAKNGMRLQAGGEIQNTYAPDYLYDDLGYEPLNDSNVKQYYQGGDVPRANFGIASAGGAGFGENPYGGMAASMMGNNNAGSQLGGSIGSIFGPVGGLAGSMIGGMLDTDQHDIDKYNRATKANMQGMAINNMIPGIHSGYRSHMEDGGWVSNDWQPQVITQFGGLDQQDFYDYAHDGMQSLRAGGHIRGEYQPISNRGMQQYAMGGEVQTTWGGHAETISHNPYMPGTGETIMFRGKSHDESDGNGNTGIGVKYGKGGHDSYTDYAEYGTQEADADVEVERGEPAAELQDANGEKNLTVYGNLKIPNQYIDMLGDPKAKGKKFKNYVADLSKIEAKQNKIVETSTNKLNALNVQNSFDKLKLTSLQASIQGANMKLKDIADKKINAAHLQNAINDTAEENGLVADDLARGKVKFDKKATDEYAKYGKSIPKAQFGIGLNVLSKMGVGIYNKIRKKIEEEEKKESKPNAKKPTVVTENIDTDTDTNTNVNNSSPAPAPARTTTRNTTVNPGTPGSVKGRGAKWDYTTIGPNQSNPEWQTEEAYNTKWAPTVDAALDDTERAKKILAYIKTYKGPDSDKIQASLSKFPTEKEQLDFLRSQAKNKQIAGIHHVLKAGIDSTKPAEAKKEETKKAEETKKEEDKIYPVEPQKRNTLLDLAGQILPFFRPTDQEAFDYAQLYPEMYAMATNQLEPVQAQGYQPDLATPYDISYQDQLNANQADYNASQKMVGYNPAAQSLLNAQKYAANTGVLGEQFRANQAMKMGVYDENRKTLNDAKLKNLAIYDQQYERQAQAKSNTKAVTQAALNSIADKYAKHKLENRELGIYENLYNYRYDSSGRAINMNAPWQANVPNVYNKGNQTPNMRAVFDQNGNFLRWERIEEAGTTTDETLTAAGKTPGIVAKKNGGSTKAKNGSIVSAYKNL